MKKRLMNPGVLLAVLIGAGIVGFFLLLDKGSELDREAKEYVDKVTPIILANLNKETLYQYASEEFKTAPFQDAMFAMFARLGQLREYKGSNGQTNVSDTSANEKDITGVYQAEAEFETGPAIIKLTIIKRGDRWQIIGFNISSAALAGR